MIINNKPYMKKLLPLSTFVTIVVVLLSPLSLIGGIYSWPCVRLAVALCLFYVGCHIGEKLSGKIGKGWRIGLSVAATLMLSQKFIHDFIYDKALCLNLDSFNVMFWDFSSLFAITWYLFFSAFILIGIVVNSALSQCEESDRFWEDLFSGFTSFTLYMVACILPKMPEFFTNVSDLVLHLVRFASVLPMVCTLVYVYRCVQSEKVRSWVTNMPRLAQVIASMCPGAIFLMIFYSTADRFAPLALVLLPTMAYIFSVIYRFVFRLLKAIISKDFGWKEVLLG